MIAIIDYGAGNIFSVKTLWTILVLRTSSQTKKKISKKPTQLYSPAWERSHGQ